MRVVRETVGPGIKVMVDANCAYRHFEAIEMARKIEKYDISWFEEPVFPDDCKGHQLISQSTVIPVATGENEYTRYGFRELIENRCVDILQPDAQIMGGITEFMKVAALAQSHDLTIARHGNQEVHVQFVAAIPNGLTVEFYRGSTDPMWGQMFEETLMIEDGYVRPSERPGMGIVLNDKAPSTPPSRLDDRGRTMQIGILTGATGEVVGLPSLIQEVVQAEGDGFDSFWLPQVSAGPGFDALTALALAGSQGNSAGLGTGVVPIFPIHPLTLANRL